MPPNREYRKFFLTFVGLAVGMFAAAFAFNAYCDPLLLFSAVRPANRVVPAVDARMQKTNHLVAGSEQYDALLLGSSRVEHLNSNDFLPLRVFNYSAPSFYPDEAEQYLDFFLKKNGATKVVVYLGLDFYGSNAITHEHARPPKTYLDGSTALFAKYFPYLGADALNYSLKMLRGKRELFNYDRVTLNKVMRSVDAKTSENMFRGDLEKYRATLYGTYRYNKNYPAILEKLKNKYPGVRFEVFTTPVTAELFHVLIECGRLPDYEVWLADIVKVFGRVHNFMFINRFTADRRNFLDAHHIYPDRTTPLVNVLIGRPAPDHEEYARLLTERNLPADLAVIRQQAVRTPAPD